MKSLLARKLEARDLFHADCALCPFSSVFQYNSTECVLSFSTPIRGCLCPTTVNILDRDTSHDASSVVIKRLAQRHTVDNLVLQHGAIFFNVSQTSQ